MRDLIEVYDPMLRVLPGGAKTWIAVASGAEESEVWVEWPVRDLATTLQWRLPDTPQDVPVRIAMEPSGVDDVDLTPVVLRRKGGGAVDEEPVIGRTDLEYGAVTGARRYSPDLLAVALERAVLRAGFLGYPRHMEVLVSRQVRLGAALAILLRLQDAGKCSVSVRHLLVSIR